MKIRLTIFFAMLILLIGVTHASSISLGTAVEKTYARANPGDIVIFKMYIFNPGDDKIDISINTKIPNKYWKTAVYPTPISSLPSSKAKFSCLDEKWIYTHERYVRVCTYYLYVYVPMKVTTGRYNIVATAITNPIVASGSTSAYASQARNFVFTVDVMKDGEPVPLNVKNFVNITKKSIVNFMTPLGEGSYSNPSSSGKNYIHIGHDTVNPEDRFKNVVTLDDRVGNSVGNKVTAMATSSSGSIIVSTIILIVGGIVIYFWMKR